MTDNTKLFEVPKPIENSWLYRHLDAGLQRLPEALSTSMLSRAGRFLSTAVQDSGLYRWLTKEPDPEVIVIDLRETWTVGPFIWLLDRVVGYLGAAYADSRVDTGVQWGARQFRSQPIRVLAVLVLIMSTVSLGQTVLSGEVSTAVLAVELVVLAVSVAGLFVSMSLAELLETKPMQLLVAAFEPPEPPES